MMVTVGVSGASDTRSYLPHPTYMQTIYSLSHLVRVSNSDETNGKQHG